jgi:hypothetical protein
VITSHRGYEPFDLGLPRPVSASSIVLNSLAASSSVAVGFVSQKRPFRANGRSAVAPHSTKSSKAHANEPRSNGADPYCWPMPGFLRHLRHLRHASRQDLDPLQASQRRNRVRSCAFFVLVIGLNMTCRSLPAGRSAGRREPFDLGIPRPVSPLQHRLKLIGRYVVRRSWVRFAKLLSDTHAFRR